LVAWNADIHQYRAALTNPELAPCKAEIDVRSDGTDAEDKLLSLMAEIMAVITLTHMGYRRFTVLMPAETPLPDFEAEDAAGAPVSIEVKNLREPEDIVRTVAKDQWRKRSDINPERYNFLAVLSHSHKGALTLAAKRRLRSIVDVLPDATHTIDEELDGGVDVRFERAQAYVQRLGQEGAILKETIFKQLPDRGLVVVSGITKQHLESDISELQALFLKVLRRVVESTPKFFGETFTSAVTRIIALRWEAPDVLYNPEILKYTAERIENVFADFQLGLRVVVFTDPELPIDLIRQYSSKSEWSSH